jgi:hypothetical protein
MELLQKQGFSPQAMGESIKVWTHQLACCCTVASRFSPYEHLHWCSVCDPAKIFFPFKVSYIIFSNPARKTKNGITSRWETTNSKAPGQSETGSSSHIIFITLFSGRCSTLLCLLPASAKCARMLGQIHFAEPNWHVLTFLHPILICRVTY